MSNRVPIAIAVTAAIMFVLLNVSCGRSGNRVEINQVVHGWVLEYSGTGVVPDSPGRVKKFEFNNKPVAVPQVVPGELPHVRMLTPVGTFVPDDEGGRWLLIQPGVRVYREKGEISDEELSRGYYEVRASSDLTRFPRRKGTPRNWCIIAGKTWARWIAPDKIDQISWVMEAVNPANVPAAE